MIRPRHHHNHRISDQSNGKALSRGPKLSRTPTTPSTKSLDPLFYNLNEFPISSPNSAQDFKQLLHQTVDPKASRLYRDSSIVMTWFKEPRTHELDKSCLFRPVLFVVRLTST
ncbi:uncharacterized protein H6S33_004854 [Morchella sextelata]|uniref:uncharacterized protein n=1 Tax=Morchella sextelata TaxID=1174677 RepID=UPI001D0521A5|nr:uncharacterized protein H6S33_004854 [Morchella sextelata]KAH0605632.1 hypothetical protein H6S33_004854 [Morchella sextelata]